MENYIELNRNEYPGIVAGFYDVVYEKIRDKIDRKFYIDRILATEGPVLEVGCGSGRLLVEALEKGADIYGIDLSNNMLDVLRSKIKPEEQHRISQDDMRDFYLNKKFKLIYAPFRVFSHMYTVSDQLNALKCIKNHLDDDGVFIFDLYVPNPLMIYKDTDAYTDYDAEIEPGKTLRRIVSIKADYINQLNTIYTNFEVEDITGINSFENKFNMRYYFRYELEHLIKLSGLKLKNMYGDYNYSPLSNTSNDFVTECVK